MAVLIQSVEQNSFAGKVGICAGDVLVSINGHEVADLLDYRFYSTETNLTIGLLRHRTPYQVQIAKPEYADLGLEFETYLMDKQHRCTNKCIFCFVDQMPAGMRETLYFKDDDSRMSFLFGNYITLTNLTDAQIDRMIKMRISPINISVHTTDPALRVKMMKNPKAADSLAYIKRLCDAGLKVNAQLVLCPGWNDGDALKRSLSDLGALYPQLQSIACVPVGLTRYREGLANLVPYDQAGAQETIGIIHAFADKMQAEHGVRVAYPSDEFFLKAGWELPEPAYYGDFDQLEDGVGGMTLLKQEFMDALEMDDQPIPPVHLSIATGEAATGLLSQLAQAVTDRYPQVKIAVYPIINRFFGEHINVAGLITGKDLAEQLTGRLECKRLLLPSVMLRHERDCFLDDMTVTSLEQQLDVQIEIMDNDGYQLYDAMTGKQQTVQGKG